MEEHFILRVPQSVAERVERVLNRDPSAAADRHLDLAFDDARSGTFMIGQDRFPVSLLDLPCVVESYKTYDHEVVIKAADIGQVILVREEGEPAPEVTEYMHGLTPAMRDARRRRFRREPDLNPDLVHQVEGDLVSIMAGGSARDVDVEVVEQETDDDDDDYHEAVDPAPRTADGSKNSSKAAAGVTTAGAAEEGLGNGNGDGDGDGDGDDDDFTDEDDESD